MRLMGCIVDKCICNPFSTGYGYYWHPRIEQPNIQMGGHYGFVLDGLANDYTLNIRNYANNYSGSSLVPNNGAQIAGKWTDRVDGQSSDTIVVFGGVIGVLHSFRLYSRALSASEIAANYAVDKARFDLP